MSRGRFQARSEKMTQDRRNARAESIPRNELPLKEPSTGRRSAQQHGRPVEIVVVATEKEGQARSL